MEDVPVPPFTEQHTVLVIYIELVVSTPSVTSNYYKIRGLIVARIPIFSFISTQLENVKCFFIFHRTWQVPLNGSPTTMLDLPPCRGCDPIQSCKILVAAGRNVGLAHTLFLFHS